jgi:hypothetical protein
MKVVFTGLESAGKSLMLSRYAEKNRIRAKNWLQTRIKLGLEPNPRTLAFNQEMSEQFKELVVNSGLKYKQFRSFDEVEFDTETDFHIDELLKFFPSRGSEPLPFHVLEWITQGAKNGNKIFACSQDFSQVHKQFRILTNKVFTVRKMLGTDRPIRSMPPINSPWGIFLKRSVKPSSFKGDMAEMETTGIPSIFLLRKNDIMRYDTLYHIPPTNLPDKKLRPQRIITVNDMNDIISEKITYRER